MILGMQVVLITVATLVGLAWSVDWSVRNPGLPDWER